MENEKKELNPDELEQADGGLHIHNQKKSTNRTIAKEIKEGQNKTTMLDRIVTKCVIWVGDLFRSND